MTQETYFHNKNTTLEYYRFGSGPKFLLCFHGFNETPLNFSFLSESLSNYTIISIALFYHGKSTRSTTSYLEHDEWLSIMNGLLIRINIDRFSILAFSMGGRFAMSIFKGLHSKIDHLILAAPDCTIKRFWYELATFSGIKKLFYFFMHNPKPFFKFIKCLESMKIMNTKVVKFALSQLRYQNHRTLVYNCWTSFKYLTIKPSQLVKLIHNTPTHCVFIFGKYDQIIQLKHHQKFLDAVPTATTYTLESGHHKLISLSHQIIKNTLA